MMSHPYQTERAAMVADQIRSRGIDDVSVLEAFLRVPRHVFVPTHLLEDAYRDCPLPIGDGQTISQPYMVATMTAAAGIAPGARVLEIGTGSGYQAAILAELAGEVFSIERHVSLSETAGEALAGLGYQNIRLKVADGTLGWKSEAPFSSIIVTAGAPQVPDPLVDQLSVGGKLVIPIEDGFAQVLQILEKTSSGTKKRRQERCTFVPLVGEHGWKQ